MIYYPGYVMFEGYEIREREKKKKKLKLALKTKASLISEGSLQAEGVFNKLFLIYCSVKQGNNLLVVSLC